MTSDFVTRIFIVAVACICVAFSAAQWVNYGSEATITYAVREAAHRWPLVPFLVGLLIGHLFWSA